MCIITNHSSKLSACIQLLLLRDKKDLYLYFIFYTLMVSYYNSWIHVLVCRYYYIMLFFLLSYDFHNIKLISLSICGKLTWMCHWVIQSLLIIILWVFWYIEFCVYATYLRSINLYWTTNLYEQWLMFKCVFHISDWHWVTRTVIHMI